MFQIYVTKSRERVTKIQRKKMQNRYNFERKGVGFMQLLGVCVCPTYISQIGCVIVSQSVSILFFDGLHDDDVCNK